MKNLSVLLAFGLFSNVSFAGVITDAEKKATYIGNAVAMLRDSFLQCEIPHQDNDIAGQIENAQEIEVLPKLHNGVLLFKKIKLADGRYRTITALALSPSGHRVAAVTMYHQHETYVYSGSGLDPKRQLKFVTTYVTHCKPVANAP